MSRRKRARPQEPIEAQIENLAHEGRGIARVDGKTVFVEGALPGERVRFQYTKIQRRQSHGQVLEVLQASPDRVTAECEFYHHCGGCRLQHLHPQRQIEHKQAVLLEQLAHIGRTEPETISAPLVAGHWGYRRKARLGVKYVTKKGRVLVGFREKLQPYIAQMSSCLVLHARVGCLIEPLAQMIDSLTIRQALPQIEVSMGDDELVLIFRVLQEPSAQDRAVLQQFAAEHQLHVYLQTGGLNTVAPLSGEAATLSYRLPDDDLTLTFGPTDFTQVNFEVNRLMVRQALEWLTLQQDDKVLDLFCGIGNFTLPIARHAKLVCGVEGDAALVDTARGNAARNQSDAQFFVADLTQEFSGQEWMRADYNKLLLDPPRCGALEMIREFPALNVEQIVYVSCNPATLARDAYTLVHEQGYRLHKAGVIDMFPHTAHVESMALFQRT